MKIRKLLITFLTLFVVSLGVTGCLEEEKEQNAKSNINITPIPKAPETENQYIGFMLKADWMDGYIRVRFPEDINSSLGRHFLDNLQPELKRVSDVKVPDWNTNEETGKISYKIKTEEGIHFSGTAFIEGNTVFMEFKVMNETGAPQDMQSQICLDMSTTRDFNERIKIDSTYACFDGGYGSFDKLTCDHSQEKFDKIGYNWILMLHGDGPHYETDIEDECFWWIVDQKADIPLIWRESADGEHLVAMTWESSTVSRLMTNTNIPCMHTDPLRYDQLPSGQEAVWRGRIYLIENNPDILLSEYKKDENK